ncbi:LytR/AlgR family response regulator transcription factor [Holdemania massiliensis]|uniref:LytR/AlgR family response regulator transcription factor n=1 Tax=Holdemania massiliensis TaxID=1468449 RepID=UPI0002DAF700|nr:LytTR family DNA-binding domain-containing protein [Holdemania massiliensis]
MIKVAICDDNIQNLELISRFTRKIANNLNMSFIINEYSDLKSLQSDLINNPFDIFLLDIWFDTEKTTSLSLAQKLSDIAPTAKIIFLTNYPCYFPEVYICQHIYCILKEDIDKKLPIALEKAISIINKDLNYTDIPITMNRITKIVPTHDILYLEKSLRKIQFVCRKSKNTPLNSFSETIEKNHIVITTYGGFDKYFSILPDNFVQTHRSYIVNMNYVKTVSNNTLVLFNDEIIPISRNFRKHVSRKISALYFDPL